MSDIKFETINGQLCQMVEPEPLTLDSNLPCVVRYIQDDSPMGRYLKRKYYEVINTVIEVNRIGFDNRVYSSDKTFIEEIECLEIIGYPVEEGSHWWAWQMLKQNYILVGTYWGDDVIVSSGGQLDCEVIPIKAFRKRKGTPITEQDFISHAETNGWQIYKEPKPEPEYKVGEWVEYGGKHYQITSVNHNCTFLGETLVMFSGVIWGVSDLTKLRKLDPSEVRVKITLEGQVTKPVDNAGGRFWLYYSTDEYVSIELDALSHKDRELVESLLEAQEEK